MTAKTDRTITLSITAAIVAALSSCTNVNEEAKANLAPKPATKQVVSATANTQPGAVTAQANVGQVGVGQAGVGQAGVAQPGSGQMVAGAPVGYNTPSAAASQQPAVMALTQTNSGNAAATAIDVAAGRGPIPPVNPREVANYSLGPTVASVPGNANAPANVSDSQPIGLESEALQPDVIALQSAIPRPRPASMGYSSPVASTAAAPTATASVAKPVFVSFAMLDAQFDTSAPSAVPSAIPTPSLEPASHTTSNGGPTVINGLVNKYAAIYGMPSELIHRVIRRESRYNPSAYHRGNYGLMQIRYATAKSLGYDGRPEGLFDPETNLKYAIKYLRGAWMVAENNTDSAVRLYARGYYGDAKRKRMLDVMQ
jgi:soluble lytic murein transglycosylase-like protein